MFKPKVYCCCKMTFRYKDELVYDALKLCRGLTNHGFEPLHPVITEDVMPIHEMLLQGDVDTLIKHWKRDKKDLQDCHIVLDDRSCNKSDGVGVELGIARFAYWKPVIRIFPDAGICISRLEYDHVFDNAADAMVFMQQMYGTRWKLFKWRVRMLAKSLPRFVMLQIKFLKDLL